MFNADRKFREPAVKGRPPTKFFRAENIQYDNESFLFSHSFLKCKTAKAELNLNFPETKNFLAQNNRRLGIPHFFCAMKIHNFCILKSGNQRKTSAEKIWRQKHESAFL
jgi:hypothetical protein